jgi:hypothetical protein
MGNMADGLNMAPRPGEPESALEPGMAAPAPRMTADAHLSVGAQSMPDTSGPGPTALVQPATWVYDIDPGTGVSRATYNGEVNFTSGGSATAGVTSWNTRTGAVALTLADVTGVGGAPLNSPTFINANANTPAPGDSTTKVATTMFVAQAIVANPIVQSFNGRTGAVSLTASDITTAGGAPLVSPAFTGNPTAPTASQGDADSSIATTMFVSNAIASGAVTSWNGRQGAVALNLSDVQSVGGAPINSPTFTGTPASTTAAPGTATTQIATCAFVTNAITGATTGVSSFNTRTGAVVLSAADVTTAGGAPIVSPTFTGTPAAPTPTAGDQSTKLATTQFVATAINNLPAGVSTFNGRSGAVTQQLTDITSVGGAPLASPNFSGTPIGPTPTAGDNSTRLATTAFVMGAGFATATNMTAADNLRVLKAGDSMSGTLAVNMPAGGFGVDISPPAGSASIRLNAGASGSNMGIAGQTAGTVRWIMNLGDGSAEGAGDAGSDFKLQGYGNAGGFLGNWLTIARANGTATFGANLQAPTVNTSLLTATANGYPGLNLNTLATSGNGGIIGFQTGGKYRWVIKAPNETAQSGGNAGGDFAINNYADNGTTVLGQPIFITRSTGIVAINGVTINNNGISYAQGPGNYFANAWSGGHIYSYVDNTNQGYISLVSDARLKTGRGAVQCDPLADVLAMQLESFDLHSDPGDHVEHHTIGFIAQQVREVAPDAVDESPRSIEGGKASEDTLLTLKLLPMLARAFGAIQKLEKRVIELEAALHSGGQG